MFRIIGVSRAGTTGDGRWPGTPRDVPLVLCRGPGFGDGHHPTTQLCLQAVHAFRRADASLCDFGSGSGILSIAAARLGYARVTGVEIDAAAVAHAERNARMNAVEGRVRFVQSLSEVEQPFTLVIANILLPVLVAAAPELVARCAPGGRLVLSGLLGTDVPEATARFAPLLGGERPQVYERAEWRALGFQRAARTAL